MSNNKPFVRPIGDAKDGGVLTLLIDLHMPNMTINSYVAKSGLANYALFSTECAKSTANISHRYLNLFEIMVPDDPNFKDVGNISRANTYVNELRKHGLDVAGVHFHWFGGLMQGPDVNLPPSWGVAIHHQNIGMDPAEFVRRTCRALQAVGMVAMSS
jgi:hypothetical protein